MRVKRCFCISNQTGGSIQLFIKNASPLVHLYNVYFSAAIPMVSQWLQEVVVYLELARAVGGNLQKRFPLLPSTPLTLVGQSLGACLQCTAKYGTEIPSRCIHAALLGKENHEIWKQRGHVWHCCARPCKFSLSSVQLIWSGAALKLYGSWFWSSHEHRYLKEICFTLHRTVQTCQRSAWTLKSYL